MSFFPGEVARGAGLRFPSLDSGFGRGERVLLAPEPGSVFSAVFGGPVISAGPAVLGRSLSNSLPRMAVMSFFIKIQLTCNSFHFLDGRLTVQLEHLPST